MDTSLSMHAVHCRQHFSCPLRSRTWRRSSPSCVKPSNIRGHFGRVISYRLVWNTIGDWFVTVQSHVYCTPEVRMSQAFSCPLHPFLQHCQHIYFFWWGIIHQLRQTRFRRIRHHHIHHLDHTPNRCHWQTMRFFRSQFSPPPTLGTCLTTPQPPLSACIRSRDGCFHQQGWYHCGIEVELENSCSKGNYFGICNSQDSPHRYLELICFLLRQRCKDSKPLLHVLVTSCCH